MDLFKARCLLRTKSFMESRKLGKKSIIHCRENPLFFPFELDTSFQWFKNSVCDTNLMLFHINLCSQCDICTHKQKPKMKKEKKNGTLLPAGQKSEHNNKNKREIKRAIAWIRWIYWRSNSVYSTLWNTERTRIKIKCWIDAESSNRTMLNK